MRTSSSSSSHSSSSAVVSVYLTLYNVVCFFGWLHILWFCAGNIFISKYCNVRKDTQQTLRIVQTVAILEIVHSFFKLTNSPISTTVLQVGSRIFYVWAIFDPFSDIIMSDSICAGISCYFTTGVLTSWALVEVIRYSFYALSTALGSACVPYIFLWMRYSAFLVLYVTGIFSELGVIFCVFVSLWQAWPQIDAWKLIIATTVLLFSFLYVPGAPKMYGHMLKARKKQLGGSSMSKKS